jgi:hypothetical protein
MWPRVGPLTPEQLDEIDSSGGKRRSPPRAWYFRRSPPPSGRASPEERSRALAGNDLIRQRLAASAAARPRLVTAFVLEERVAHSPRLTVRFRGSAEYRFRAFPPLLSKCIVRILHYLMQPEQSFGMGGAQKQSPHVLQRGGFAEAQGQAL